MRKRISALTSKIDHALEDIASGGGLSSFYWQPKIVEWESERKEFESRLQHWASLEETNNESIVKVLKAISNVRKLYDSFPDGLTKVRVIKLVASNLLLSREKIEPVYNNAFKMFVNRGDVGKWYHRRESNPHILADTGF